MITTHPDDLLPRPLYRNPFTREVRPLMIRESTPLSRARSNDFPSPRIGGSGKNYEVLPNFQHDSEGRALESKEYMMAHFKGLEMAKKNRRRSLPGVGGHVPRGPLKVKIKVD